MSFEQQFSLPACLCGPLSTHLYSEHVSCVWYSHKHKSHMGLTQDSASEVDTALFFLRYSFSICCAKSIFSVPQLLTATCNKLFCIQILSFLKCWWFWTEMPLRSPTPPALPTSYTACTFTWIFSFYVHRFIQALTFCHALSTASLSPCRTHSYRYTPSPADTISGQLSVY